MDGRLLGGDSSRSIASPVILTGTVLFAVVIALFFLKD